MAIKCDFNQWPWKAMAIAYHIFVIIAVDSDADSPYLPAHRPASPSIIGSSCRQLITHSFHSHTIIASSFCDQWPNHFLEMYCWYKPACFLDLSPLSVCSFTPSAIMTLPGSIFTLRNALMLLVAMLMISSYVCLYLDLWAPSKW